jgi:hypothetical protein
MPHKNVIPGRVVGANPEPMNTDSSGKASAIELNERLPVFMGSGFIAARCPGMTR